MTEADWVSVGRVGTMGLTSNGIVVGLNISNSAPKIPSSGLQATVGSIDVVTARNTVIACAAANVRVPTRSNVAGPNQLRLRPSVRMLPLGGPRGGRGRD